MKKLLFLMIAMSVTSPALAQQMPSFRQPLATPFDIAGPAYVEASCETPWGAAVAHGGTVTAYADEAPPFGEQCASETRTCDNGTLSGSYAHASCSPASTMVLSDFYSQQTLNLVALLGISANQVVTPTSFNDSPTGNRTTQFVYRGADIQVLFNNRNGFAAVYVATQPGASWPTESECRQFMTSASGSNKVPRLHTIAGYTGRFGVGTRRFDASEGVVTSAQISSACAYAYGGITWRSFVIGAYTE